MKRRRHGRRTSAQNKGAVAYIVVSYVPLLRGAPGLTMAPQGAAKLLESVSDADTGHVEAIVWAQDDSEVPWPVLVLERADEVFEHLVEWSEGSPATWFKLAWLAGDGEYALALFPRVDKSVERYKLAHRLGTGQEIPADARFQVVFRPILFRGPESALSREMLQGLPACVRVGFLSRRELPSTLAEIDPSNVRHCGPLDVEHDSADLDRLLGGPGIPGGR